MPHQEILNYYETRYASESLDAFPADPSRYRVWLRSVLDCSSEGTAALDFGCGVGYVSSLLADDGCNVVGVDISSAALSIARAREKRVQFVEVRPGDSLPFESDAFDLVTCLGVIEHAPDPEALARELRRVARRTATAVWVVPNARSPFFWFGHGTGQIEEHPRSLDGWRQLLIEAGWTIENVRRDPGPLDRPVAVSKRLAQSVLNRLPLGLTYQFVIETRAA